MSAKQRIQRLSERLATPLRSLLHHRLAQWIAAALFLAAVVAIVHPPRGAPERWLDLVPGDVAPADIHATHAFEVSRVNPDEVARRVQQAEAEVLPVWDYHPDRLEAATAAIRATFDRVRARLRQESVARARLLHGEGSGDEGSGALEAISDASLMTLLTAADRARIAMEDGAFAQLLAATEASPETDEPLRVLAADGFSLQAEQALTSIVSTPMGRFLVQDRDALSDVGSEGLVLRTVIGDGVHEERIVRDLRDFIGESDVDAQVWAASQRFQYEMERDLLGAVVTLARPLVRSNTALNHEETASRRRVAAAEAEAGYLQERRITVRHGERIVARGEVVTPEIAETVAEMQRTSRSTQRGAAATIGLVLFVTVWMGMLIELFRRHVRRFSTRPRDLAMMALVLAVHLLLARLTRYVGLAIAADSSAIGAAALLMLTPFAAGAMVVRVVTSAENALAYGIAFSGLVALLYPETPGVAALALLSSVAAVAALQRARTRTELVQSGLATGAALALGGVALAQVSGGIPLRDSGSMAAAALVSGVLSAGIATFLLPLVEGLFRYTTSLRLMELANLNHPALRDLVMKAPGTYHHSLMVGQLVEAACEAVDADALLGRVGAYFHDIGKTRNPQYFAENQSGGNPHQRLKPHMSALVIRAHVKDGVEMARQHGLPERIIDFIREHHGTSRIGYFYQRAVDEGGEVDEGAFRYPGPRPQTRETAICLLADGVEAASRALPEPTPQALRQLVHKMVQRAQEDGQLDECGLTMRELHVIRESFLARLNAFYHHRPEYPEPRDAKPAGRKPTGDWDAVHAPPDELQAAESRADAPAGSAGRSSSRA